MQQHGFDADVASSNMVLKERVACKTERADPNRKHYTETTLLLGFPSPEVRLL